MSPNFHKLKCVPRSVLIAAKRKNKTLDPEELYQAFSSEFAKWERSNGSAPVSFVLDIGRRFDLFRHLDVTHDVDRAGQSMATADVFAVMLIWERVRSAADRTKFVPHFHAVVATQIMHDQSGRRFVQIESPEEGTQSRVGHVPVDDLKEMQSAFLILFG